MGIPVILLITCSRDVLSPNFLPSLEKNVADVGAISSWSVHPRVNHLLFLKADPPKVVVNWLLAVEFAIETSER